MTRLVRAWDALDPQQRLAGIAALALLVTMFLPWYELQSLQRKSGTIHSHSINAFGDVSFVEAAIFLVAAGVLVLLFSRAERRVFHMPGSDGTIVTIAGCWAALLIFYRVFSRPDGNGYPVGIQWGFFLAFIAAGGLAYAGWRMRALAAPEPPLVRRHRRPAPPPHHDAVEQEATVLLPSAPSLERPRPVAAQQVEQGAALGEGRRSSAPAPARAEPTRPARRPRYPPAPSDQLSFDDAEDHRGD